MTMNQTQLIAAIDANLKKLATAIAKTDSHQRSIALRVDEIAAALAATMAHIALNPQSREADAARLVEIAQRLAGQAVAPELTRPMNGPAHRVAAELDRISQLGSRQAG